MWNVFSGNTGIKLKVNYMKTTGKINYLEINIFINHRTNRKSQRKMLKNL